jgi:hypothetical protein
MLVDCGDDMDHEWRMSWQQAVAALTAERERAETAARIVKRLGDAATVARAERAYGDGKAETDAIVAALTVALAENREPETLAALEARLHRATAARETIAREADACAARAPGEKAIVEAILGSAVLVALTKALTTLYLRHRDDEALTRKTIETQLQAARWADFASLEAP